MSLVEVTAGAGRAAKPVEHSYAGALSAEERELISGPRNAVTPPLKRMRDRHHTAAKAFASGLSPAQVQAVTGYDGAYLSILQNDPSFKKLISDYRGVAAEAFVDVKERMASLLTELVNIVHDRVEADPDSVDLGMANELIKSVADRSGFAPVNKTQNTNVNIDIAAAMRTAREKLGAG